MPSLDRHTRNSTFLEDAKDRGRYGRVLAAPDDESRPNDSVTVCVDTDGEPHQSLNFRSWKKLCRRRITFGIPICPDMDTKIYTL
jgi:hypothetical protein